MKRTSLAGAMPALALAAVTPNTAVAQERVTSDHAGAAIAAIIAVGIGVAIARHGNDHALNSDWDHDTYGQPFSPSQDVVCLPQPRQCYQQSHYSARWTRRIFGS